jgi:hypothetical protein
MALIRLCQAICLFHKSYHRLNGCSAFQISSSKQGKKRLNIFSLLNVSWDVFYICEILQLVLNILCHGELYFKKKK